MRPARFLFWLRRLVAAFLVVSLVVTPAVAAAESPDAHTEIAQICDDAALHEADASVSADHAHDDGHDHKGHGCGTCHFHWLSNQTETPMLSVRVAPGGAAITSQPLVRLAATGPYRPPRG